MSRPYTVPSTCGRHDDRNWPVAVSKAASLGCACSLWPGFAPGGRTVVKLPPAYSTPLVVSSDQSTLLVCHIGRASAAKGDSKGASGDRAAWTPGVAMPADATVTKAVRSAARLSMSVPPGRCANFLEYANF